MRNRSLIQTSLSKKIKNKKIGGSCNWEVQVIGSLQTWLDWQAQIILLDPCLSLFISCHYLTFRQVLACNGTKGQFTAPNFHCSPSLKKRKQLFGRLSKSWRGCSSVCLRATYSTLSQTQQLWGWSSMPRPWFLDYLWGGAWVGEEAPPHPNHKHRCDQVQGHLVLTYLSSF